MAVKEKRKLSELQKACLLKGKLWWRISNSYQLAKFLAETGNVQLAAAVESAISVAKYEAAQISANAVYEARKAQIAAANKKE